MLEIKSQNLTWGGPIAQIHTMQKNIPGWVFEIGYYW